MVQWQDPAVQSRLGTASIHVNFLLLGMYGWEYLSSLDVEYSLIRSRMAFRWSLLPYLVGRICLLICLILMSIESYWLTGALACSASVTSSTLTGTVAIGCASTNLMIRTWAIWKHSHLVRALLSSITFGHWILVAVDIASIRSSWENNLCGVVFLHPSMTTTVYIYTVCYDLIVFALTAIGLSRQLSKSPLRKQLLTQGLSYFVIVAISYIPATVFSCLHVEPMVSITGLVALCASMIASCRAVKSLLGLRQLSSNNALRCETGEVALTTHIQLPTSSDPSSSSTWASDRANRT